MNLAPPPQRALVVSLHDVSPHAWEQCDRQLGALREIGIKRCSLLVIPNYHHHGPINDHPAFCTWLRAREKAGDEIVIHGYFHERRRRSGERLSDRWMTRFYTAGEGEFFDIARDEAVELVSRAQREFASAGLHPRGFIAPAWLLSKGGREALRETRCRYTTSLGGVLDLETGEFHRSQSVVYSVRAAWRRILSMAWNPLLFHRLRPNPLLRISLHPPDIAHTRMWRQICALLATALVDRTPFTYEGWLERVRVSH